MGGGGGYWGRGVPTGVVAVTFTRESGPQEQATEGGHQMIRFLPGRKDGSILLFLKSVRSFLIRIV